MWARHPSPAPWPLVAPALDGGVRKALLTVCLLGRRQSLANPHKQHLAGNDWTRGGMGSRRSHQILGPQGATLWGLYSVGAQDPFFFFPL